MPEIFCPATRYEGCAASGKTPEQGAALRVCSGCRSVSFCDKACQRKGWPQHKSVCHRAQEHRGTDPHSSKPSSSPPEHRLLRDFGGCHRETFAIINHSTLISYALTEPGVSFDTLDCTNLYVYITLSPRLNHDGNPALAFIVLKIGILLFDDVNVELREQIELKPQTVKALQEARSEKWGAHLAARGILLVLHVPDLGISVRYDTYIRETRGPTTPDIKDPRLVFAMLKACIAEGLVMKSSIIELEEPRFGRMVKKAKNKNWTWEVVPPSEVDQMVHTCLHVALLRIMIMGYQYYTRGYDYHSCFMSLAV